MIGYPCTFTKENAMELPNHLRADRLLFLIDLGFFLSETLAGKSLRKNRRRLHHERIMTVLRERFPPLDEYPGWAIFGHDDLRKFLLLHAMPIMRGDVLDIASLHAEELRDTGPEAEAFLQNGDDAQHVRDAYRRFIAAIAAGELTETDFQEAPSDGNTP